MSIKILLPAYNEEKDIGSLVLSISEFLKREEFQIIIVDDGSSDDTVSIIEKHQKKIPIMLLRHKRNRGLGKAIETGLQNAIENFSNSDVIVTMDADNSHDIRELPQMIDKINENYDIVIASRYVKGAKEVGVPFKRKIYSRVIRYILTILFPIKGIKDYTCGYRAYRASFLKKAATIFKDKMIQSTGFSAQMEILIKFSWIEAKVSETPIVLRYNLKRGKSKLNVLKTIVTYLEFIYLLKTTKKKLLNV